jgi:malonate-semialdehyde dehydrogenase (acetylating) / methylmalonate-semialdehyde dehydrogenase
MPDASVDAYLSTIMNSFYGAAGQRYLANSLVLPVGAVVDGREAQVPERPKGYFVGPTLLDNVRPEMRVYREEIFTESGAAARKFRYEVATGNVGIDVGGAAPMAYFPFSGARGSLWNSRPPVAAARTGRNKPGRLREGTGPDKNHDMRSSRGKTGV